MSQTPSTGFHWASLKWLWVTIVVVALDYFTKQWITAEFAYAESKVILPIFNLTLLHNTGAAFSFLANAGGWQRWFFTGIAVVVSTVIFVWMAKLKPQDRWLLVALSLILGGALGNLYDRLVYGYVIDFLHFHWDEHFFPAFNLADTAISIGAFMMIVDALFLAPKKSAE